MYLAKPNLNNSLKTKIFKTKDEAAAYLEEVTGHKMYHTLNSKTREKIYDWELIGKLVKVK